MNNNLIKKFQNDLISIKVNHNNGFEQFKENKDFNNLMLGLRKNSLPNEFHLENLIEILYCPKTFLIIFIKCYMDGVFYTISSINSYETNDFNEIINDAFNFAEKKYKRVILKENIGNFN